MLSVIDTHNLIILGILGVDSARLQNIKASRPTVFDPQTV